MEAPSSWRGRANGPVEGIFLFLLSAVLTIGLAIGVGHFVLDSFRHVGAQLQLAAAPAAQAHLR